MIPPEKLKTWLINTSFGQTAVRNQGKGIIDPIRDKLEKHFDIERFFKCLKQEAAFKKYLDDLTFGITSLRATSNRSKIKWGTARKCINLLFRSTVYNGFLWQQFNINESHFKQGAIMSKLELPLDSYAIKGLKCDCKKFNIDFDNNKYGTFTITRLNEEHDDENDFYQGIATEVAKKKQVCRINLDIYYWREKECK